MFLPELPSKFDSGCLAVQWPAVLSCRPEIQQESWLHSQVHHGGPTKTTVQFADPQACWGDLQLTADEVSKLLAEA